MKAFAVLYSNIVISEFGFDEIFIENHVKSIFKNRLFIIIVPVLVAVATYFVVLKVEKHYSAGSKNYPAQVSDVKNESVQLDNTSIQPANQTTDSQSQTNQPPPVAAPETIPNKYLISVPFQPQAPFGDWSEPYESACEEASITMVEHYLNKTNLSRDQMKREIDAAVAWQIQNWGGHNDLNATQTLKLANDYFKLNGKIISSPTTSDLKKLLAKGEPVIVPTAGRKLGNPNFTGVGPEYHMLVLVGYDDTQGIFITNDPGTRKGERYIYKYDTIIHSISGPKVDMKKELVVLK